MFEWLFGKKKDNEMLVEEMRRSFELVKKDINDVGRWIEHLNTQDSKVSFEILQLKSEISSLKDEIEQLKEVTSLVDDGVFKQLSKHVFKKQTAVYGVQTAVQTPVQTAKFYEISNLSVTERAIIAVLLSSDLKLSYDDVAAVLGKDRSTIRGQINSIKQKNLDLVEEVVEKNGRKRIYIPDEIKMKLLKKAKVRAIRVKDD